MAIVKKTKIESGQGYPKFFNGKLGESPGQTLIETLAAIFILIMGITAAVGLAIYALGSSTNITKQIIATGLAREGVEAIKNMRDTNWLKDFPISTTCYNYATHDNSAKCYTGWLGQSGWQGNGQGNTSGFGMDPQNSPGGKTYTISYEIRGNLKFWNINTENSNFGLDFDSTNNAGFYIPAASANGSSAYYRKINITKDSSNPFRNGLERLIVTSQVWWTDKKCPRVPDWPGQGKCSIEIKTNLTNWKTY